MYFSIQDCLAAGWATFKRRPGFFVLATLLALVINGVSSGVFDAIAGDHPLMKFLAYLANFLVQSVVGLGVARVTLHAVDSVDSASLDDAWQPPFVLPFLGASILYSLMVGFGFVFLIVPGVILAIIFAFWPYPVAEGAGPINAPKYSRLITKGHRWRLFLFFLVLVLVNVLGFIALVVGLLVSIPVTALAAAHAYRALASMADERSRMA
ncbi:MAG: hypothetical protein R3D62_04925 [Xanthobacteraceae bacterium]